MPRRKRRNVEMGFWRGGKFHPIRRSDDYEPDTVGERWQWKPRRAKKKKNPRKSMTLKNFTGTVRKNPDGTVSIIGRRSR